MKRLSILCCIALLLGSGRAAGMEYYRSNALGMELERVSPGRAAGLDYVLEISRDADRETRVVRHRGDEYRRWEIAFEAGRRSRVSYYQEGVITSVTAFDEHGLSSETFYREGSVDERRSYQYENGLLSGVVVAGPDGEILLRIGYERSTVGRLRRIVRHFEDERAVDSYGFAEGRFYEEWHGYGGAGVMTRYDEKLKVSEEEWAGNELRRSESIERNGETATATVLIPGDEMVIRRTTGADGQVLSERTDEQGSNVQITDYRYDDSGRVLEMVVLTEGMREAWVYSYGEEEFERTVRQIRNGRTVKVTRHTAPEEHYEVIYRDGEPVLQVFFVQGVKTSEVFLGGRTVGQ